MKRQRNQVSIKTLYETTPRLELSHSPYTRAAARAKSFAGALVVHDLDFLCLLHRETFFILCSAIMEVTHCEDRKLWLRYTNSTRGLSNELWAAKFTLRHRSRIRIRPMIKP